MYKILCRFLGDTPSQIFYKLLFYSLLVGSFMYLLDWQISDLFTEFSAFLDVLYQFSGTAIENLWTLLSRGAFVVLPLFIFFRLVDLLKRRKKSNSF